MARAHRLAEEAKRERRRMDQEGENLDAVTEQLNSTHIDRSRTREARDPGAQQAPRARAPYPPIADGGGTRTAAGSRRHVVGQNSTGGQ